MAKIGRLWYRLSRDTQWMIALFVLFLISRLTSSVPLTRWTWSVWWYWGGFILWGFFWFSGVHKASKQHRQLSAWDQWNLAMPVILLALMGVVDRLLTFVGF